MAQKKLTPMQKQYKKQQDRLNKAVKAIEKRGYIFQNNPVPETPKRITKKALQKIKDIKPKSLYEKAIFVDTETGEIRDAVKQHKLELKLQREQKKLVQQLEQQLEQEIKHPETQQQNYSTPVESEYFPNFTDVVIANFKSYVLGFPKQIADQLISFINKLINEQGEDDVAQALQDMPDQFHEYLSRLGYDSNSAISEFSSALLSYLPNASEQYKSDAMDAIEYNELGYEIED